MSTLVLTTSGLKMVMRILLILSALPWSGCESGKTPVLFRISLSLLISVPGALPGSYAWCHSLLLSDCCQWNSYDVCLVRVKNQIKDIVDYGTVRIIVPQSLGNKAKPLGMFSWRAGLNEVSVCVIFCLFVYDRVFCGTGGQWTYDPYISTSDKPSYTPSYFAYTCPSAPLFYTWLPGHHKGEWFPHHVVSAWTVAGGSQVPGITWLMQPSTLSNVAGTLYDGHYYPTPYADTDTETWGLSIIHLIWSCRDLVSIPLNPVAVVMT